MPAQCGKSAKASRTFWVNSLLLKFTEEETGRGLERARRRADIPATAGPPLSDMMIKLGKLGMAPRPFVIVGGVGVTTDSRHDRKEYNKERAWACLVQVIIGEGG